MRVGSNRKVASILVAVVATVGLWGKPAHAASLDGDYTSPIWNRFVAALINSSDADPWALDCTGGPRPNQEFYLPALASGDVDCTVNSGRGWWRSPQGPSAGPTPSPQTPSAKQDLWHDAPLLWASVVVDGRRQEIIHVHAKGNATFPTGSLLGVPGERTTYYEILRGSVIDRLKSGEHTIVVTFSYADGFAGTNTFHLHVV